MSSFLNGSRRLDLEGDHPAGAEAGEDESDAANPLRPNRPLRPTRPTRVFTTLATKTCCLFPCRTLEGLQSKPSKHSKGLSRVGESAPL